ncbi:MAG: hypothetical protein RMM07_07105 [Anaerolineae bacterium]|nr:hypothetical protein [Anaerolineae bacterium]
MKARARWLSAWLALALVLSACAGGATPASTPAQAPGAPSTPVAAPAPGGQQKIVIRLWGHRTIRSIRPIGTSSAAHEGQP